jgi:hypothetical protein
VSWAKIDDQLHGHRKILRAWKCRPALGLHFMAMSYSASHEPKGFVPEEFVEEKLPAVRERSAAIEALTDTPAGFTAGLWVPVDGGWNIHDWDEYNGDAKTREEVRAAKSAAGKKGAEARWGKKQTDSKPIAECHTPATPSVNGTGMAPFPHPSNSSKNSPVVGGRAIADSRAAPLSIDDERQALAEHVRGILQRGIDGLTTNEKCKPPTRAAILAVLTGTSWERAESAAVWARSAAQSQNRAPNIVALFAQRLHASSKEAAA